MNRHNCNAPSAAQLDAYDQRLIEEAEGEGMIDRREVFCSIQTMSLHIEGERLKSNVVGS